jgi:hypothetical protein
MVLTGKEECTFETWMKHCYNKHGDQCLESHCNSSKQTRWIDGCWKPSGQEKQQCFVTLEEANVGALGLDNARCFGKFNQNEGKDPYHKPAVLFAAMKELFNIGSDGTERKVNGQEMRDRLRMELDPVDVVLDLKLCRAKRGTYPRKQYDCHTCDNNPCICNGMCPPKWMCDQFIMTHMQARKKKKNKVADSTD